MSWIVEVINSFPFIDRWIQVGKLHIFLMSWVRTIERPKFHVSACFDYRLRLTIQVDGTILTVPCSKLLARNSECAVSAIADEYASTGCTNEDL